MSILPIFRRPRKPEAAPAEPRYIKGVNATTITRFTGEPGLLAAISELNPDLIRLPGGTIANYYHGGAPGHGLNANTAEAMATMPEWLRDVARDEAEETTPNLDALVAFAKACGRPVIWVANIYTGSPSDYMQPIAALFAAGVKVVGVEIGNEAYLSKYASKYPSAALYMGDAKAARDTIKERWPALPCAVCLAPSPDMSDAETGDKKAVALTQWNAVVRGEAWPDAHVIHSYAQPVSVSNIPLALADCKRHRDALIAHAKASTKPVWVTEWNVAAQDRQGHDTGNTAVQQEHITAMITAMRNEPAIAVACLHSLAGSGTGNNAIKCGAKGSTLTLCGNAFKTA